VKSVNRLDWQVLYRATNRSLKNELAACFFILGLVRAPTETLINMLIWVTRSLSDGSDKNFLKIWLTRASLMPHLPPNTLSPCSEKKQFPAFSLRRVTKISKEKDDFGQLRMSRAFRDLGYLRYTAWPDSFVAVPKSRRHRFGHFSREKTPPNCFLKFVGDPPPARDTFSGGIFPLRSDMLLYVI